MRRSGAPGSDDVQDKRVVGEDVLKIFDEVSNDLEFGLIGLAVR